MARDFYIGAIFRLALQYADMVSLKPMVLSAKYGIVKDMDILQPYNEKLKSNYDGPWPDGDGFFVGGPLYFSLAPKTIQPLIPFARYGEMCAYLNMLLSGRDRDDVWERHESPKRGTIIQTIYLSLLEQWLTKDEIYLALVKEFGPSESMKKTINAQLSPNRMGREKNCEVLKDGEKYHIKLR
jgi:hypothetical protein